MLAGSQAFEGGETVSDAVAAILRADVDWTALPAATPPHIVTLLRRCLQKDPQKRLPHIGVARLEIDEGSTDPAAPPVLVTPHAPTRPVWKRAIPIAAAAMIVGAITAVAAWVLKPSPPLAITRFSIPLAEDQNFTATGFHVLAISPTARGSLTWSTSACSCDPWRIWRPDRSQSASAPRISISARFRVRRSRPTEARSCSGRRWIAR